MNTLLLILILSLCSAGAMAQQYRLKLTSPTEGEVIRQATPLRISFEAKNQSWNASIAFFLVKNIPEQERAKSPGHEGPIMATSIEAYEKDSQEYYWDGKSFGCGQVTTCEHIPRQGPYRIEAVMYKGKDLLIVDQDSHRESIIARAASPQFIIGAKEDTYDIEPKMKRAALTKLRQSTYLDPTTDTVLTKLLLPQPITGPDENGRYCQISYLDRPFIGKVVICTTKEVEAPIKASSDISTVSDIVAYDIARNLAVKLATARYAKRVDFVERPDPATVKDPQIIKDATYLQSTVTKWAYNKNSKRWNFLIRLQKMGGLKRGPDRFDDDMFIEIIDEKIYCIVNHLAHKEALLVDIEKAGNHCDQ